MVCEFVAAIPGQRRHQSRRQSLDVSGESAHDGLCIASRQPNQADIARAAFHERGHVRVAGADEEVPFPVAGHGAVVGGRGSLPNGHGVDDVAPGMARRALRSTIRAALAKVRHQRLLQHAATLDEEAEINRLV